MDFIYTWLFPSLWRRFYEFYEIPLGSCWSKLLSNQSPSRKPFHTPAYCRALSIFSTRSFSILGLKLRSLTHLNVTFVHVSRFRSSFMLLHVDIHFSHHSLLKILSFIQCMILGLGQILDFWSSKYSHLAYLCYSLSLRGFWLGFCLCATTVLFLLP